MLSLLAALPAVLVVEGFVVGSRSGRAAWTPADETFARRHAVLTGRAFGVGTVAPRARRVRLVAEEIDQATYADGSPDLTFLGGAVPRVPRPVTKIGAGPYVPLVARFLAARGLRVDRPRIVAVHRADLDGDGTAEVLIEASSPSDPANQAPAGAYSLVLLRAIRGGRVVETPLALTPNRPGGYLSVARVRGVADLDGDGRLEVAIGAREFEGSSATLWAYRAGTARKLLENGVGH